MFSERSRSLADKKLFTPLSGTQRIFEAVLIAITLMAAYLLLALLSYHPADPGSPLKGPATSSVIQPP